MAAPEPQRGGAGQPLGADGATGGEEGGSADDQAPQGSAEGAGTCLLTSLPDAVVAGLWPAERVIEGFAVCSKGLSRALRSVPKVVLRGRMLGKMLGDEEAEAVAGLLVPMVGVKWLDFGGNSIGARVGTALAGALRAMTGLEHLDLGQDEWRHDRGNGQNEDVMAIAPFLPPSLTHLDLSGNKIGVQGAKALARALEAMTGLRRLYLGGTSLGWWRDEEVRALAGALPGGLLHLGLDGNDLKAQHARVLGPCLPQGLLHLTLRRNWLSIEGVRAIAPWLPPSLQDLDIGFNQIGVEGAEVLVRHLPRSMLRLSVCCNELGTAGAEVIVRNLPPLLEHLDLSCNNIGCGGWDGEDEEDEEGEDYDAVKQALRLYLKPRVRSFDITDSGDEEGSDGEVP